MSRYQKGKTNLDFTEARDSKWQWHKLGLTIQLYKIRVSLTSQAPAVCFLDGSGVLYNNFVADSSSSPDNQNTDYSCAVAATGHWEMARCNDKHRVVCQSDYNTLPGILQANSMSTS